ncbi:hypothetical protein [Sorangium sp. So ce341]|uniref:hypothetical protein n=1 Tax=Sorangium sp. So ce341 TaxID=3133302 RepID=UPI003F5DCD3A
MSTLAGGGGGPATLRPSQRFTARVLARKTRRPPSAAAKSAEINRASVAFQKRAV